MMRKEGRDAGYRLWSGGATSGSAEGMDRPALSNDAKPEAQAMRLWSTGAYPALRDGQRSRT